jgi:uncharacterized protein (TIGR02757 family)
MLDRCDMRHLSLRDRVLGDGLERLYRTYGPETAESDPIVFVRRYADSEDRQAVAWIAAAFAYGRVATIQHNVSKILAALGPRPAETLRGIRDFRALARDYLGGFRHRFHTGLDAAVLLFVIGRALDSPGSLRGFFEGEFRPEDRDVGPALSRVVAKIHRLDFGSVLGRRRLAQVGPARFFFPDPASGSACKRWNLLMRWMVRRDLLDFGLWTGIPTDRLVVPTDTHIHLVARRLGLTRRKTADWKTAREITDGLARFDPADPVRFDYALCRIGIFGVCQPDLARSRCPECLAREACSSGRRRMRALLPFARPIDRSSAHPIFQ